jgi:hypothetical protein
LPASEVKLYRPTIKGRHVSFVVTSSGHRKAFHEPMKVSRATVNMGAVLMGITMRRRKRR